MAEAPASYHRSVQNENERKKNIKRASHSGLNDTITCPKVVKIILFNVS